MGGHPPPPPPPAAEPAPELPDGNPQTRAPGGLAARGVGFLQRSRWTVRGARRTWGRGEGGSPSSGGTYLGFGVCT